MKYGGIWLLIVFFVVMMVIVDDIGDVIVCVFVIFVVDNFVFLVVGFFCI